MMFVIATMRNVSCYLHNNAISIDYEHNFRAGSNPLTGIASHLQLPDHYKNRCGSKATAVFNFGDPANKPCTNNFIKA